MRIVIQRVLHASVIINKLIYSKIGNGLLIFVGIEELDNDDDIYWLIKKIANLRIFNDENGIMNLSITDIHGEILVISQFTLLASTKKGNRPSYSRALNPEKAVIIYNTFISELKNIFSDKLKTGKFGEDMQVKLINDGPVTILMDSKNKE
jgi:D-tyrosyl-tRNA(Tyr) deacylase